MENKTRYRNRIKEPYLLTILTLLNTGVLIYLIFKFFALQHFAIRIGILVLWLVKTKLTSL